MSEAIEMRIEGDAGWPTLIYLPGVHGDWTMIGNLSRCLRGTVRLVVITYPRTLTWSLAEYGEAVESALELRNIHRGWLLAESFSSQVAWTMLDRAKFGVQGIILAGGFVRHPMPWIVRPAGIFLRRSLVRCIIPFYRRYVMWFRQKDRGNPKTLEDLDDCIARRTNLDLQAMRHRLDLIAGNNPCAIARRATVPVYGLAGWMDPIVPWPFVRRWLRRNCPALRDYQIIPAADHNVLTMAARPSADLILRWMQAHADGL